MATDNRRDEDLELSIDTRAEPPELDSFVAEYLRIQDRKEELYRKLRALDSVNPIGGLSESRWREFDAQRAARRRSIIEAAQRLNDEAAPA
jgi:hypothetical protein